MVDAYSYLKIQKSKPWLILFLYGIGLPLQILCTKQSDKFIEVLSQYKSEL